ncbi:hypothetical protein BKA56DRAFT_490192, partial [Ilyonectria sp. MPI-CAGE-AT-0026]
MYSLLHLSCVGPLALLSLVTIASASGLDDFSNDLATDVGPLLALFGEKITIQYFSESTSFLDYFIFAMAPIGIVTAMTSAIRVCGDSSLRAFIGRAQEGDGTIEAELCTSTSRDVCELFHRGGITRVFGRPKILEIVHIYGTGRQETAPENTSLGTGTPESPEPPRASDISHPGKTSESPSEILAQNPNISINIGIMKLPRWLFRIVALLGLVLQSGVIAMAAVMSWTFQWTKDGAPESLVDVPAAVSKNRSPTSFIIGTVCLCCGMFACAALIGESTKERRYQRTKGETESKSSQLFWVQPGNQVIGDETFDAFAYVEDADKKPLLEYTTSSKRNVDHFHPFTWAAVILALGGYIAQFIGLRGMNASISIAQLGVTIFMSLLRSCLRIRRLKRTDNRLGRMPDIVLQHELDWLAFEI